MHTLKPDRGSRQAVLVDEFLPIDVTQALEEGQRAKCVGVSDLHIARHCLDQSHEALQLRRYVIWGQGINTYTHRHTKQHIKGTFNERRDVHCFYNTQAIFKYKHVQMSELSYVGMSS